MNSPSAIRKAVVPAAGRGTRLYPLTKVQPKEMMPLGHQPVIQAVIEELAAAGITDILVVTGPGKSALEAYLDPQEGRLDAAEHHFTTAAKHATKMGTRRHAVDLRAAIRAARKIDAGVGQ